MKFNRYSSIENSYRTKFLNKINELDVSKEEFIVTEKIHGSNFSVWYDGSEFEFAKRSQFLKSDNFFNYQEAMKEVMPRIRKLYLAIKRDWKTAGTISIYGELFGGHYPHKDVEKLPFKQIQKGVAYTNQIGFYAFDLFIDGSLQEIDFANKYFEEVNLFHAKTLFRGSLDDCLKYPNDFQSTIPALFGLPEIEDNVCEGVVIKPNKPLFLYSGSRIIIKNKNEKWTEKSNVKREKKVINLTEDEQKILDVYLSFITENRLKNVISKVGLVTQKDFGKLMGLFQKDAYDDFIKDNSKEYLDLDKDKQGKIKREFGKTCAELIRKNFLDIIDGEY